MKTWRLHRFGVVWIGVKLCWNKKEPRHACGFLLMCHYPLVSCLVVPAASHTVAAAMYLRIISPPCVYLYFIYKMQRDKERCRRAGFV
jgi:hypothetical protein